MVTREGQLMSMTWMVKTSPSMSNRTVFQSHDEIITRIDPFVKSYVESIQKNSTILMNHVNSSHEQNIDRLDGA